MEPQINTTSPLSAKYIFLLVILLVLSSAIGSVVGGKYYPRAKVDQVPQSISGIVSSNYSSIPTNSIEEIRSITGTVVSIKGSSFILHQSRELRAGENMKDYTIYINYETKITRATPVDMALLGSKIDEYQRSLEDTKKTSVLSLPPQINTITDASLEDVKIGDTVIVNTTENIGSRTTLLANKVQIEPKFDNLFKNK